MKKMLMILPLFLLTGCVSEVTLPGESTPVSCVGFNSQDERDSTLVYKVSTRNLVVGIIFVEMIAPPVIVALNELWCPVRRKTPTMKG
jgi:hypothetical protein